MKLTKFIIISLYISYTCSILAQQKNVNAFDEKGKTPLINAISEKDFTKVKELINEGANVNLKEKKGLQGTPLMYATSTGNIEFCKLLLENGASINDIDINKDPAINWATYYGYVKIMNYLIDKGADINMISKHGNAIDVTLRLWHHDSVANVFRAKKIKKLAINEYKLIKAINEENYVALKKLFKKGVSPNLKDELGIPILQLVSQDGNDKMVDFLVRNGADINCTNRVGQTPLSWAVRFGHEGVVKYLLNAGANPNKTGEKYQLTPLIAGAVNGNPKIVELLLDKGAIISHREVINNATALHWSIFYGNTAIAELLINRGANYSEKALEGNMYSAIDLANVYKNENLQSFINTKEKEKKQKELIGSWKIKEIHYLYPDTTYIRKELDYGRLIVTNKHYAIQYQPMMMRRIPFKNLSKGEDSEIKKAFQTIVFNSGSYILEDDVIHTTADIAKVPGFEGGQQYYKMNLSDEKLTLIMFDETYPNGKKPEWYGKIKVKFLLEKE